MELIRAHSSDYLYLAYDNQNIELEVFINRIASGSVYVEIGARTEYIEEFAERASRQEGFPFELSEDSAMTENYISGFTIYTNRVTTIKEKPDICRALQRATFWERTLSEWMEDV